MESRRLGEQRDPGFVIMVAGRTSWQAKGKSSQKSWLVATHGSSRPELIVTSLHIALLKLIVPPDQK